jgi:hypothetical protein
MSFNPSKCTVIRVAPNKSKTVIPTNYQLHGHTLEIVDSSKYLGVTVTSNLSWDKHVDNVAAKGNRTLGFIRRNLKDRTRTVKDTSYTAIVRPTIKYAVTVWDPTSQSKIKALENIQRRATRFVTNNYTNRTPGCVTNMITSLGWQSLEQRKQNSRLCMLCKIQHNLIDINRDLYIRNSNSRTRGQHRLFLERTSNETYRNSFFQRTETGTSYQPAQLLQLPSRSLEELLDHGPHVYSFNCKNMERFRCK